MTCSILSCSILPYIVLLCLVLTALSSSISQATSNLSNTSLYRYTLLPYLVLPLSCPALPCPFLFDPCHATLTCSYPVLPHLTCSALSLPHALKHYCPSSFYLPCITPGTPTRWEVVRPISVLNAEKITPFSLTFTLERPLFLRKR